MPRTFDAAELIALLRESGISSDTRQYLAANELLLKLAASGKNLSADAEAAASHLGPIFSTSPDDQRIVREKIHLMLGEPPPKPPSRPPRPSWLRQCRQWIAQRLAAVAISAAAGLLALLAAAGSVTAWYFAPHAIAGQISTQPIEGSAPPAVRNIALTFRERPIPVDDHGNFELRLTRAEGDGVLRASLAGYVEQAVLVNSRTQPPVTLLLRPPVLGDTPVHGGYTIDAPRVINLGSVDLTAAAKDSYPWKLLSAVSLAIVGVLLSGLEWLRRRRRDVALKRMSAKIHGAPSVALWPPSPDVATIPPQTLRRIGADLRRARSLEATSFSVEATVDATARAGGFLSPVSIARTATPEYLVLIDRRSAEDHLACVIDGWINQLASFGVAIDRYYFNSDPRLCWNPERPHHRPRLTDLLATHNRSSVLVFADAAVCLDPLRRELLPWARALAQLPRCALLTAEPEYRWSRDEALLLDAGLIILSASIGGLERAAALGNVWQQPRLARPRYARAFPKLIAGDEVRWLDRNAPPAATVQELLVQLHGYLGPSGYQWLCACAVYPQTSWSITLSMLAALMQEGDDLGRKRALDEHLPALARLPWFRYGYMPDWLRRLCIAGLPVETEKAVRRHLSELLFKLMATEEPGALGKRPAKDTSGGLNLWLTPLDIASFAPAGSPLNDAVFMGFIGRADPDPLALRLRGLPPAVRPRARGWLVYLYGRWRLFIVPRPRLKYALISLAAGAIAFTAPLEFISRVPPAAPTRPISQTLSLPTLTPAALFQVSEDGKVLVLSAGTSGIALADAATGTVRKVYTQSPETPTTILTLDRSASFLATAYNDGKVVLWNLGSSKPATSRAGNAVAAQFSANGEELVLVTPTSVDRVGASNGAVNSQFSIPAFADQALSPGGELLALGDAKGNVTVWDTRSGKIVRTLPTSNTDMGLPLHLSMRADGLLAATRAIGEPGATLSSPALIEVRLLDSAGQIQRIEVPARDAGDFATQLSPAGDLLALHYAATVVVYDLAHNGAVFARVPFQSSGGIQGANALNPFIAMHFSSVPGNLRRADVEILQWSVSQVSQPVPAPPSNVQVNVPGARGNPAATGQAALAKAPLRNTQVTPNNPLPQAQPFKPTDLLRPLANQGTTNSPRQTAAAADAAAPVAQTPAANGNNLPAAQVPAAPTGLTVNGEGASAPIPLERTSFITTGNGETVSIINRKSMVLGQFTATLKSGDVAPGQVPTSGTAILALRGLRSLSPVVQTDSFIDQTLSFDITPRYSVHTASAGILTFNVSVVADTSNSKNNHGALRVDVALQSSQSPNAK